MPDFLNYHHLRYFREIARELSVTRAAARLNLSPPALSIQLRQLEDSLGQPLFERGRGGLRLTEAGRVALDYAETIGRAGEELMDVMRNRAPGATRQVLRVGAVATLSRNFQLEFLKPALHRPGLEVVIRSGAQRELLQALQAHEVDLVLSNSPARRDAETPWHSHLLAEQEVGLVGVPAWRRKRLRFPADFRDVPVILPSLESNTRAAFDRLTAAAGVRPRIIAEVDDMAMQRLLAREGEGMALVPPVVVRDEIQAGMLVQTHRIREIQEVFFAITPSRRFPNALVGDLVSRMARAEAR
ncbi:MAG TPA: LysR family transcriptional regulator [Lacunisphaera sp.]|nr:LysR family transcriptional regulator [Lacunisphaera sp.]